ncbi:MAG: DegV family protein [Deltaproteobacteria bacterium]
MARYVITDSTAYLPADILERYNIITVPLNVHLDDNIYKEGVDITNDKFYHLLRSSNSFPTTSQPSAGEFLDVFSQLKPEDEAIVILISSDLSGTLQSAEVAHRMLSFDLQDRITVVDSRFTAMGLGFQVIKAAEMLELGYSCPGVLQAITEMQARQDIFFIVNDLQYLVRGGRLSKTSGLLGNLLQVKPILYVHEGRIELFDKVRTTEKALGIMMVEIERKRPLLERLGVIHVQAPIEAVKLKHRLEEEFGLPATISEAGPVVGSHAGPGALGIAYC